MEAPKTNSRREYMREYQLKRYHDNEEKARGYINSLRIKKRNPNLPTEWWDKYKHHLADIVKIQVILKRLPMEVLMEILPAQVVIPLEDPFEVEL